MFSLDEFANLLQHTIYLMKQNLTLSLTLVGVLWVINVTNWVIFASKFNILGIYPRKISSLSGIIFSPIFHAGVEHLFFNSIPLFLLLDFMLLYGLPVFYCSSLIIILINGILVWLLARPGIHLGASGVIMGYWSFLLVNAVRNPSGTSIIIAAIMLYYLGGLLLSLFPSEEKVSFEGHIFGFIGGIVAAFLCL